MVRLGCFWQRVNDWGTRSWRNTAIGLTMGLIVMAGIGMAFYAAGGLPSLMPLLVASPFWIGLTVLAWAHTWQERNG